MVIHPTATHSEARFEVGVCSGWRESNLAPAEETVMESAVIVSAVRTPVGSFGGQFKDVPATELGACAVRAALERAGISVEDVDEVVLAGGMENMTRAPYLLPSGRFGARMGDAQLIDSMVHDGLWDAFNDIHMGITAENLADQYGLSREEQDEFAAGSQQKAERAIADGVFSDEIVAIEVPAKGGARLVDSDEAPARGRLLTGWRSYAPRFAVTAAP